MTNEEKKKNPITRLLTFLVTLVLVLGALFLVANWQKLNFDSVKRYFTYHSLTRNESGQAESYLYTGGVSSRFACLGDDLLVCSTSGIRLYSPSGTAYIDKTVHMENPVVTTDGNSGSALVYDAGGTQLFVCSQREIVFSYTSKADNAILSASLNAQGLLTMVTQASGLKGSVTVYNAEFQPVMSVNLSSRFIYDAILSPDGSTLALATSGQYGGIYDGRIDFYSVEKADSSGQPDASCPLGSSAVLALNWNERDLRVLCDDQLALISANGTLTASYSYQGRYLKGFAIESDNFVSLLLGKYRAGSDADLVTVNLKGEELARVPMDRQVLSLSSAGRYLAVLTADELTICTRDLEPYHTLEGHQGIQKVLQRPDGTAMLISGETASLYLPD